MSERLQDSQLEKKYDSFFLFSHQRSGSHYIAAILEKNFFKKGDYIPHYRNHIFGPNVEAEIARNPKILYVYAWRSSEPCLRSIFKLKTRFGLKVDTYDKFLDTPYSQMWTESGDRELVYFNYLMRRGNEIDISYYFRHVERTPGAHWLFMKEWWVKRENAYPNVMLLCYDDFIQEFQKTMDSVALRLGVPKKEKYLNEFERVGWMTMSEAKAGGRMP